MADAVSAFIDAGSAIQQGDFDAAAADVAPVVEQQIEKQTKPKPGDDCAAAAAKGAVSGAAAGAGAGAAIGGPFGALIGAGVGALAGGLAAGAEGGCFDASIDWKAEARRVWDEAPFFRRVDIAGATLRKGESWTPGYNAAEKRLAAFPIGKRGLTIGGYMHLMRRARELGGGSAELARIVSLVAPAPASAPTAKYEAQVVASKGYKDIEKNAKALGATDAGKMQRNLLKQMRIGALVKGGFDRAEAQKRVLGKAFGSTEIELRELRRLISAAEPTKSYTGPLVSIFGRPKPGAGPATTRALDADGQPSAALPIALGAAAVGAYFLLAK